MGKKKLNNSQRPAPAAQQAASANMAEANRIEFDVWYAMREAAIPGQHHREILKADFKGRGLKEFETVEAFDIALQKYGISL